MNQQYKQGFTLIEMLVVIGIIGVLIGMGAVSYSSAQKKARDSKRQSDLQAIQNGLEQYYSVCGYQYPYDADDIGPIPTGGIACPTPTISIIDEVPLDPLGNSYAIISADVNNSSYTICPPVVRDAGTNDFRMETSDCTSTNLDCCIKSQQ